MARSRIYCIALSTQARQELFPVGAHRRGARLLARQRPRIKATDASAMRPHRRFPGRGISPRCPTFGATAPSDQSDGRLGDASPPQVFPVGAYRRDARLFARQRRPIKATDASAMRPHRRFPGRGISPRCPTFGATAPSDQSDGRLGDASPPQVFPVGAYRRDARLSARQRPRIKATDASASRPYRGFPVGGAPPGCPTYSLGITAVPAR